MSETWQRCGACNGQGGREEERLAEYTLYNDNTAMNEAVYKSVSEWVGCSTCLGMGRVAGGSR